ncbi:MAG: signal peptide peptidase SppA [Hyphomicrobiaceae bacterium]
MTLETEVLMDRRRLRRSVSFWRILTVVAAALVLVVLGLKANGDGALLGERKQIARVTIEGLITENREQLQLLDRLAKAKHVPAVLLFINSPGGTTTGGEALYEGIRRLSAQKPVIAQFGTVAASAAYICGLATDHIVARGNTITGSVGVIFQWAELTELLGKVGVKMHEIKSGPLKANPSPFQPLDPAGRETAEKMVKESMVWFRGLVAERRKIDTAGVPGLEQGRVYSGREALTHKLIDEIGGEREAVSWLERERKIEKGLKVVDWKPKKDSDWSKLGLLGKAVGWLFGVDVGDLRFLNEDSRFGQLLLDGLVSVWQPVKNKQ